MDSENPISNVAAVLEGREISVAPSTSAGSSNDTMTDKTTATPIERENASKKGKTTSQEGKTVLKERKEAERKRKATHPPTSEMVLAAIKELKKRNGASLEDIHEYIEDHYTVDIKRRRHHLNNFLITGVEKGILEQLGKSGAAGRFKIKEKKIAEKETAKKEKQITTKETAKKQKQSAVKGAAKKGKQNTAKGAAKKGKQNSEKETPRNENRLLRKALQRKRKNLVRKELLRKTKDNS